MDGLPTGLIDFVKSVANQCGFFTLGSAFAVVWLVQQLGQKAAENKANVKANQDLSERLVALSAKIEVLQAKTENVVSLIQFRSDRG